MGMMDVQADAKPTGVIHEIKCEFCRKLTLDEFDAATQCLEDIGLSLSILLNDILGDGSMDTKHSRDRMLYLLRMIERHADDLGRAIRTKDGTDQPARVAA